MSTNHVSLSLSLATAKMYRYRYRLLRLKCIGVSISPKQISWIGVSEPLKSKKSIDAHY